MIDHDKRRTLTMASAGIVSTLLPPIALSNVGNTTKEKLSLKKRQRTLGAKSNEDVSVIVSNLGKGSKAVTLKNNTDQAITVKHVYPGIVDHEGVTININEAIGSAGCTLAAGTCRILAVNPMNRLLVTEIPKGVRRSKPSNISILSTNQHYSGNTVYSQPNWHTVMFA